jgi:hypothetical protein
MDGYKSKNYLFVVIVLGYILIALLTGCSSTKVVAQKPQYCHTSQTIVNKDGERVTSTTTVECTDDQIKRLFEVRSGMAPNCGVYSYWMQVGGNDVKRKGVSCQKPDGTWEVINNNM